MLVRAGRVSAAFAFSFVAAGCSSSAPDETPPSQPDLTADTASLPKTDIFVGALSFDDGAPRVEGLRAAVANPGYDNQPSFLPGKASFYFVSEGESGKTDIWRYDVESGASQRLFHSPLISEYSPKAAPAGYGVSYIQENEAADVTRVHHMPLSGGAGAAVIDFAPLGYYAWLNGGKTLAVYLRSEPATLHLVDIATGNTRQIDERIGRSLQATPDGGGFFFTAINEDQQALVMSFSAKANSTAPVTYLPDGAEDFAVAFSDNGAAIGIFAAAESALYFHAAGSGEWRRVGDFSGEGIGRISRIALSDDNGQIAIVAEGD